MLLQVLMQSVERIRGEFFGLTGVADQPHQGAHQSRIVLEKERFEDRIGREFRPVPQKDNLVNRLHSC